MIVANSRSAVPKQLHSLRWQDPVLQDLNSKPAVIEHSRYYQRGVISASNGRCWIMEMTQPYNPPTRISTTWSASGEL